MKKRIVSFIMILSMTLLMNTSFAAIENIDGIDYMDDVYRFDTEGTADTDNYKLDILVKLGILENSQENPFNGKEYLKRSELKNSVLLMTGKTPMYKEENVKVRLSEVYESILEVLGYSWEMEKNDAVSIQNLADSTGLSDGVSLLANQYITKDDFAEILFNALNVEFGGYPIYVASGPLSQNTLLSNVFGVVEIKGVLNAIEGINLYGTAHVKKGYVEIQRELYAIGETAAENYLGCRVKGYARYDDEQDEFVLLFIEQENVKNSLVINFEDIYECNSSKLKYESDGKEKSTNISGIKTVVYNGKYNANASLEDFIADKDGRVELQATSKGGRYDMAVVWTYRYFLVDTVDMQEEEIRLKYGAKYNEKNYISIKDNARIRYFMNGTTVGVDSLKINDVIRLMSTYDGGYAEINISRNVLRGNITSIDNSENTLEINGNSYKISNDYDLCTKDASSGLKQLKVGMTGTFYISDDSKIAGFKEGSQYSFGYMKKIVYDEENDIYRIKYLSQDGDWRTSKVADKVVLDGKKMQDEEAGTVLLENKENITDNIFRYKSDGIDVINGNDSLTFIDTMRNTEDEAKDTEKMNYCGSFENFMNYRCIYLINSNYQLSTDTVIFRVPDNLDNEEDFAVIRNTQLPWGDESVKVPLELYNPNRYYLIGAAIYKGGEEAVGSEGFILIEKISEIYDEEKEDTEYSVTGLYLNGGACEEKNYLVSKSVAEKMNSFKAGDFNRYAVNGNRISGIMSSFASGWNLPDPGSIYRYADYHYISGTVIERDPDSNLLVVDYGDSRIAVTRVTGNVAVIDKTGNKPKARCSDYSAIQVGDKVFFYDIYAYSSWCIVVKE